MSDRNPLTDAHGCADFDPCCAECGGLAIAAMYAAEAKLAAIDSLPYNSEASRYADGWNHARQKIRRILHPEEAS